MYTTNAETLVDFGSSENVFRLDFFYTFQILETCSYTVCKVNLKETAEK